jgi:hypothetical protein
MDNMDLGMVYPFLPIYADDLTISLYSGDTWKTVGFILFLANDFFIGYIISIMKFNYLAAWFNFLKSLENVKIKSFIILY